MGVVDGPAQRAATPSDIPKKVLLWQKVTFFVYPSVLLKNQYHSILGGGYDCDWKTSLGCLRWCVPVLLRGQGSDDSLLSRRQRGSPWEYCRRNQGLHWRHIELPEGLRWSPIDSFHNLWGLHSLSKCLGCCILADILHCYLGCRFCFTYKPTYGCT